LFALLVVAAISALHALQWSASRTRRRAEEHNGSGVRRHRVALQ
jgi:hypothetical protein